MSILSFDKILLFYLPYSFKYRRTAAVKSLNKIIVRVNYLLTLNKRLNSAHKNDFGRSLHVILWVGNHLLYTSACSSRCQWWVCESLFTKLCEVLASEDDLNIVPTCDYLSKNFFRNDSTSTTSESWAREHSRFQIRILVPLSIPHTTRVTQTTNIGLQTHSPTHGTAY